MNAKKLLQGVLISILASIIVWSCASNETANSDTVKQSEIYQTYSVTYDEANMELSATASFRFGGNHGTTLALTSPSYVRLNNEVLAQDNNMFAGTFYQINKQIAFQGNYTFEYMDNDKKVYKNSVSLNTIAVASMESQMDVSKPYIIEWKGLPLQNGESVNAIIETENYSTRTKMQSIVGSTTVTFLPEDLQSLPKGNANIQLERTSHSSLQQGSAIGGSITATYKSAKSGFIIK